MEEKEIYKVEQAYLEMSRAFLGAKIHCQNSSERPNNNTILAIVSSNYSFAIMAITAFISAQLHTQWEKPGCALGKKYSVDDFYSLMRYKLHDLKTASNELCCQLNIPPVHITDPNLWRELNEVLKKTRDFFHHPSLDEFNDFMKIAGERNTWEFPSNVASGIIRYFYVHTKTDCPDWLNTNTDFKISKVETFR